MLVLKQCFGQGVIKPCTHSYTRTLRFFDTPQLHLSWITRWIWLSGLNWPSKTNVGLGPGSACDFGLGLQNEARLQLCAFCKTKFPSAFYVETDKLKSCLRTTYLTFIKLCFIFGGLLSATISQAGLIFHVLVKTIFTPDAGKTISLLSLWTACCEKSHAKHFEITLICLWDCSIYAFSTDDPTFESSYRARNVCWIHRHSLHFGFLVPFTFLALFNLVCFTFIVVNVTCKQVKVWFTPSAFVWNSKTRILRVCLSASINCSKAEKQRQRHDCFFNLRHDGFDLGVWIPASICRKRSVSNYSVLDFHRIQFISGIVHSIRV